MVPVENSIAGRVADIHHLLPESGLFIVGEHFQPVNHNLLAPKGATLDSLVEVHSHAQGLAQCRKRLHKLGLRQMQHPDTAGAAKDVAAWNDPKIGAIASALAGEIYGLNVLVSNAEDAERHLRQFLVLQHLEAEHVGDELPGVITGFSSSGVWVMLDRYLAEGMIGWDGMGTPGNRPDRWVRIEGTGQLVSSRSGAVLCIGDPVTVQLLRVDPAEREMDLLLKERPQRVAQASPRPRRSSQGGKRGGNKRKRRKGR